MGAIVREEVGVTIEHLFSCFFFWPMHLISCFRTGFLGAISLGLNFCISGFIIWTAVEGP
uniref:Uncharacterized protein n=1 Tax=Rhizophora mucronata TaxID=61149 RepID=A0A2P2NAB4_RHIMU